MLVAEAVGRGLVSEGIEVAFGVVGSGNFHITNALVDAGARFVPARHEGGAATMADAYARMSGKVGVLTVHQGCGLTNAMTGIAEAAKSRTPMLVVAAETTSPASNFFVDQPALVQAIGAVSRRIEDPATAVNEAIAGLRQARLERRTVVLNLPLPVQSEEVNGERHPFYPSSDEPTAALPPAEDDLKILVEALENSRRPVFVAGRGARGEGCRDALEVLASRAGALLATSAVAKGLFNGNEWALDVSGGFSSPLAAELIQNADLIVGWGCALNMWTMSHGRLIGAHTTVIQVDSDRSAIGRHRPGAVGVVGDVRLTAEAVVDRLPATTTGYRSDELGQRIRASIRWRDVPFEDLSSAGRIDPRVLSMRLDDILPKERILNIDSGNFMGYPSMFMSVPDEFGFCFTQAYQSIGLGLATAIGAALARPDRLPVAAVGDGGLLMGVSELETVVRLGIPMVVIVYNDEAYGAEVHHFGPDGHPLDTVVFPPTDIASIARGFGFEALTVHEVSDLDLVYAWVSGDRGKPLLIDAKVTRHPSWWLEEAFAGH